MIYEIDYFLIQYLEGNQLLERVPCKPPEIKYFLATAKCDKTIDLDGLIFKIVVQY